MQVRVKRVSGLHFEASNGDGLTAYVDGPPKLGGQGKGMRPMEMILVGLATCSAVDVVEILKKGRQDLQDLDIEVNAKRADTVPSVFTDIEIHFIASGKVDPDRLERAVDLSVDKYCSVARMLAPTVNITHRATVRT